MVKWNMEKLLATMKMKLFDVVVGGAGSNIHFIVNVCYRMVVIVLCLLCALEFS